MVFQSLIPKYIKVVQQYGTSPSNFAIGSTYPPINATVLSAPSPQPSVPTPPATGAVHSMSGDADSIVVRGLIDVIMKEYTDWLQLQVTN